jgi:hypothetical protein
MSTQKRVRRVFFAAAVSTASLIVTANSEVFGWESTGSGIQRVQYQPAQTPQSTAQPNAAVTAELKRMFAECSGPANEQGPPDSASKYAAGKYAASGPAAEWSSADRNATAAEQTAATSEAKFPEEIHGQSLWPGQKGC